MRGSNGIDKLHALRKRASEIRAALEAVEKKGRQQEKADFHRARSEIGAAMMRDVDAAPDPGERVRRKAYISEVLSRAEMSVSAKAFLKAKKWL